MSDKTSDFTISPHHREKHKRLLHAFSISCLVLIGLFVAATLICFRHNHELGENNPYGFALWFLLFCAYLPLEIIGAIAWLTGSADSALINFMASRYQAISLGTINIIATLLLWATIRFWGARKFNFILLEAIYHIILILCGWGCFQLLCLGLNLAWHKGGFSPLYQHLNHLEQPPKVNLAPEPPAINMPPKP